MSRWAILGILGMVERWGCKLRLVERVGKLVWWEIWNVLEACVFWSWVCRIRSKQLCEISVR
uniref:Uncharacterized protein n=1 Tax=Arundo donax TaxID=35708 RepID=A0A0A9FY61_ARUDO